MQTKNEDIQWVHEIDFSNTRNNNNSNSNSERDRKRQNVEKRQKMRKVPVCDACFEEKDWYWKCHNGFWKLAGYGFADTSFKYETRHLKRDGNRDSNVDYLKMLYIIIREWKRFQMRRWERRRDEKKSIHTSQKAFSLTSNTSIQIQ